MKNKLFLLTLLLLGCIFIFKANANNVVVNSHTWQPSPGYTQIPIWPTGKMPDDLLNTKPEYVKTRTNPLIAGKPWNEIFNVSQPTMTIYSPQIKNTGAAVIVFPGGGFNGLAIDLEGTEVCHWLVSQGITCVLLKYRVPDSGPAWHDDCHCNIHPKAPTALEDAQRTVGLLRSQASKWHINPNKIGVLGFSAGGYTALTHELISLCFFLINLPNIIKSLKKFIFRLGIFNINQY